MASIEEDVGAEGHYLFEVIRDRGHGPEVIQRAVSKNIVLNTGKRSTWRQAAALSTKQWRFFQLGHNSVAVSSGDTGVKTAITSSRKTATVKTVLAGTRTFQLVVSYPSGGGSLSAANIKEVTVRNTLTSAGATALSRALVTPIVNKTTADKIKITYNVRIT